MTGLTSGVAAIVAGATHACALTTGGAVKCWGGNTAGQLGDNSTTQRLTPVPVSTLSSGVLAIAAGQYHTCAVMIAGGVKCWGLNTNGQLGNNSIASSKYPGARDGTGGRRDRRRRWQRAHLCRRGGGVKCWGLNANGQLGDGTQSQQLTRRRPRPDRRRGGHRDWSYRIPARELPGPASNAGASTSTASSATATLVTPRVTAVDVVGLGSGSTAIAAGKMHSCALATGGALMCWGDDSCGQLGDNATTQRLAPVIVSGQPTVKAMSAAAFTPARSTAGRRHVLGLQRQRASWATTRTRSGRRPSTSSGCPAASPQSPPAPLTPAR